MWLCGAKFGHSQKSKVQKQQQQQKRSAANQITQRVCNGACAQRGPGRGPNEVEPSAAGPLPLEQLVEGEGGGQLEVGSEGGWHGWGTVGVIFFAVQQREVDIFLRMLVQIESH